MVKQLLVIAMCAGAAYGLENGDTLDSVAKNAKTPKAVPVDKPWRGRSANDVRALGKKKDAPRKKIRRAKAPKPASEPQFTWESTPSASETPAAFTENSEVPTAAPDRETASSPQPPMAPQKFEEPYSAPLPEEAPTSAYVVAGDSQNGAVDASTTPVSVTNQEQLAPPEAYDVAAFVYQNKQWDVAAKQAHALRVAEKHRLSAWLLELSALVKSEQYEAAQKTAEELVVAIPTAATIPFVERIRKGQ